MKKKPNPSRGSNDWINKIYNFKDKPDMNILTPKREIHKTLAMSVESIFTVQSLDR